MSLMVIIVYEILYAIIFFGLLFSKSTFLSYFPHPSAVTRILFVLVLFSGFYIPLSLKLMRIRLTRNHYISFAFFLSLLYILSSQYYYSGVLRVKKFHSFLQVKPTEQHTEIPKPVDTFRILCLGGSTTEGSVSYSYPDFLQEMLSKKYPERKIEVINAGKYFYSTQHAIIQYLFYLKELDPDLIIFFEGANDLMTSFTLPPFSSSPFRKDYGHFYGALANIAYPRKFEEFLSQFFYADLIKKPHPKPTSFSDFRSQYSFRRNLETLIELTRCAGIHLILSNQAYCISEKNDSDLHIVGYLMAFLVDNEHYADEKSWYNGMELFNTITKETAEIFSISFVDQVTPLKGRKDLFKDPFHVNQEGNELKARLFFEKIVQLGLLEETQH